VFWEFDILSTVLVTKIRGLDLPVSYEPVQCEARPCDHASSAVPGELAIKDMI